MPTKPDRLAEVLKIPKVHENWRVGGTELPVAVLSPIAEEKIAKEIIT